MDIEDLLDYAQNDCIFDIYDIDSETTINEGLSREELQEWHENYDYELCSFEPIQRKEDNEVVFGIVINLTNIEER